MTAIQPSSNKPGIPRVLVAIANHGTKNHAHLGKLLSEYRSMRGYSVDIVVNSNIPKNLGPDIEVRVGLPSENPWSLPFAHKELFAERQDAYDLFIYTEDDTLLAEHNINAYLEETVLLPDGLIPGFLRYEVDPAGRKYFSSMHSHYHWDIGSVERHGGSVFARYTNDHAACYILTRKQLKRAIASGGYLLPPVRRRYGMPETAATDPYTECGMKKMICISRFDEFCLHHLPNAYWGKLGLEEECARLEIARLISFAGPSAEKPLGPLFKFPPLLDEDRWNKLYYERRRDDILQALPQSARRVLSIGCGNAVAESEMAGRGIDVTAIPLDSVVAVSGAAKGVRMLPADLELAFGEIDGSVFDCIILADILQLLPEPVALLRRLGAHLEVGGAFLVSVPNWNHFGVLKQRLTRKGRERMHHRDTGKGHIVHKTTGRLVRKWLKQAGLPHVRRRETPRARLLPVSKWTLGLANEVLCGKLLLLAQRR